MSGWDTWLRIWDVLFRIIVSILQWTQIIIESIVNYSLFWVPDVLRAMMFSLIVLDILALLNIRHVFIRWLIKIAYCIYAALRIIPVNFDTMQARMTVEQLFTQLMLILPYICMIMLPRVIAQAKPWVRYVFNYHTAHLLFLVAAIILYLIAPQHYNNNQILCILTCSLVGLLYISAIVFSINEKPQSKSGGKTK